MAKQPAPAPVSPTEFVPTGVVGLDDLMKDIDPSPAPAAVVPVPEPKPVPVVEPAPPGGNDDPATFVPSSNTPEPARPDPKKPTNAMREQLEKVAAEKATADAEVTRLKTLHETGTVAFQKAQADLAAIKAEHEKLVARTSMGNPMAHPEIRKLTEPWNGTIRGVAVELEEAGLKANGLDKWIGEQVGSYLNAGEPGTDDFRANMEKIRDEVDGFTSGIRRESDRSAAQQKIMGVIRDGANIGKQVRSTMQEMQDNAPAFHYREQRAIYDTEARDYEQVERTFFNPTDDVKAGDPLNQKVILRAMIDGSEEVKKAAEQAVRFGKVFSLPPSPVDPSSLEQVEPEKRQNVYLAHQQRYNEVQKRGRGIIPEALVAYAVLPALWKELEELRKQVAGERGGPKPRLDESGRAVEEVGNAEITAFQPVSPDMSKIPR